MEDARQAELKAAEDEIKSKARQMQDLLMKGHEAGDPQMVNAIAPAYERLTGTPQPRDDMGGYLVLSKDLDQLTVDKLTAKAIQEKDMPTLEMIMGLKRAGATNVKTNVSTGGEPNQIEVEANKKLGAGVGDRANTRLDMAQEARNQNVILDSIKMEIGKGAQTGWGQETILNLRNAMKTMGFDSKDLSGQEMIRKFSNEQALRLRNPDSGLGLTGNTSNKDLAFLSNSVTGLGRTVQGNLKIIEYSQKFNNLKMETAKYQQKLIRENGNRVPADLDEKVLEFVDNYKMFSEEEMSEMKQLSQEGPPMQGAKQAPNGKWYIKDKDGKLWEATP
jgi:hypothetical protein